MCQERVHWRTLMLTVLRPRAQVPEAGIFMPVWKSKAPVISVRVYAGYLII
jgi:hypothetical protein